MTPLTDSKPIELPFDPVLPMSYDNAGAPIFRRWTYLCAWLSVAVGFLGLVGWLSNHPVLAKIHPQSVLLSPRSAVLFLVYGLLFLAYLNRPHSRLFPWLFVPAGALAFFLGYYNNIYWPFADEILQPVLLQNINSWEYVYRDRMAPISASGFMVLGLLMLTQPFARRFRVWGDLLGAVCALSLLFHSVMLMGFTYGVPFKDPRGYKPISFLGCVGMIFLCSVFLRSLSFSNFPMRFFSGKTVRAILWRTFLPVGAASIFLYAILDHTVFVSMSTAISSTLAMFVATLIVAILVQHSTTAASYSIESAVRESEKRFSMLVRSLQGHAIYMVDAEGHVLTWNRTAEKVQGFEEQDILGESFSKFFVSEGEHGEELAQTLLRQAAAKGTANAVSWHKRPDESRFWAEDVASAIYDDEHRIRGFSVITRDITIRRQAEELQREKAALSGLLQFVSEIANQATNVHDVIRQTVEQVCVRMNIPIGQAWEDDPESGQLRFLYGYVANPSPEFLTFQNLHKTHGFRPTRNIMAKALVQKDVVEIHDFPNSTSARAPAARDAKLRTGFSFGVGDGEKNIFVMEFFTQKDEDMTPGFSHTLQQIAIQMGRVLERQRALDQVTRSLREKEILLKEIHHRVKNNLQIISSLFRLQAGQTEDPQVLEKLRESQDRVRSMALIHEYLYQSTDLESVRMSDYVQTLVSSLFRSYGVSPTTVVPQYDIDGISLELDIAIPCGLIITELVSNVLKYAFPDQRKGSIKISLRPSSLGRFELAIQDDGVGLPAHFSLEKQNSLGLKLVQALTKQLNGKIEWQDKPGALFKITIGAQFRLTAAPQA